MSFEGVTVPQSESFCSSPVLRYPRLTSIMPKGAGSLKAIPFWPVTSPPFCMALLFPKQETSRPQSVAVKRMKGIVYFIVLLIESGV